MDNSINTILIKVIENTDSWVILSVFIIYVLYRIYVKYKEGYALNIIENTILKKFDDISSILRSMVDKFSKLSYLIERLFDTKNRSL